MADHEGFGPEPLLAPGGWPLTSKNLARSNYDSNRLMSKRDESSEERPSGGVRSKPIDSLAEQPSRRVITGLPRSQTFARKLSEQRNHLEPVETTAEERRKAASTDRKCAKGSNVLGTGDAETASEAASDNLALFSDENATQSGHDVLGECGDDHLLNTSTNSATFDSTSQCGDASQKDVCSTLDTASMTASQYDAMISHELERRWILNLSMHYRDRSRREKFFVTYRKRDQLWKRVTISLDYRDPPPDSLESELARMKYQRDKSAKIYEAIRESLPEIAFYDTVTNLKLQTTDGRLHVHVVEDSNEIINYPLVDQIRHSSCKRIREQEIQFDCHMSGFVYKVRVHGRILIKKEIPSPETVDEFLYEVNALSSLRYSRHVVQLYGVVVDDHDEHIKGLLISYAEQGALIDIIYDNSKEGSAGIPWTKRERWARQIVHGLADIHESGFVQGDFTLSNIVVDTTGDAKIIDINRRGCPVGWEPPEAKALVATHHRINMYIGVKSDLYQLGMVLWGLAVLEDEPELHPRPLILRRDIHVPDWYRDVTEMCLRADPRMRPSASALLRMFPPDSGPYAGSILLLDDVEALDEGDAYAASMRRHSDMRGTVVPSDGCPYYSSRTYTEPSPDMYEPYYPMRGRSPPSPLPSQPDDYESGNKFYSSTSWAANKSVRPSYSDVEDDDVFTPGEDRETIGTMLRPETPSSLGNQDVDSAAYIPVEVGLGHVSSSQAGVLSRSLGDGLQMLSTTKLNRHDVDNSGPNPDIERHATVPARNEDLSMLEDGRFHDATEGRNGNAPGIQTIEGDLDGGVSLQSEIGLGGLGISQWFSPHTEDQEIRAERVCLAEVDESTTTDYPRLGRQSSPNSRANGGFKNIRCRHEPLARQRSLPAPLAGTGVSLQLDSDSKIRDTDDMEDEFGTFARPATVQAFMGTTGPPEVEAQKG
ncbi:hypothetical protein E4U42_005650 [Claviceps africana]|uniref:Protein kinase domain-containing protein n=1 Tax=Claviceps africana TaxID=83212 RepID=A0A8K0NKG0_9HYPO|nr:hypothetical protein E4U42_005650 [Claviceps africana]